MAFEEWKHLPPPPPRMGRISWGKDVGGMLLLLVIYLATAVTILCLMIPELRQDYLLTRYGKVTTGKVIWVGTRDRDSSPVKYTYKGMPVGMSFAKGSMTNEPTCGDRIDVTYLPDKPGISRMGRPEDISLTGEMLTAFFFPSILVGAVVLMICIRLGECRLVRHGVETAARIIEVEKIRSKSGDHLLVTYQFIVANGGIYTGRFSDDNVSDDLWIGQTIPVLYDPVRPQRSGVYSFMSVKLIDQ